MLRGRKREAKFETSSLTLGGVVYYFSVYIIIKWAQPYTCLGQPVNADHHVSCPVCVGVIRHHGVRRFRVVHLRAFRFTETDAA